MVDSDLINLYVSSGQVLTPSQWFLNDITLCCVKGMAEPLTSVAEGSLGGPGACSPGKCYPPPNKKLRQMPHHASM